MAGYTVPVRNSYKHLSPDAACRIASAQVHRFDLQIDRRLLSGVLCEIKRHWCDDYLYRPAPGDTE